MTQTDLEEWLTSSQGIPLSAFLVAGSTGDQDDRHLWPEMLGLSKLSGPAGCGEMLLAITMGLDTVLLTSKAQATPAGAMLYRLSPQMPRTGERCWVLAHAASGRSQEHGHGGQRMLSSEVKMCRRQQRGLQGQRQQPSGVGAEQRDPRDTRWWEPEPAIRRVSHGVPGRVPT